MATPSKYPTFDEAVAAARQGKLDPQIPTTLGRTFETGAYRDTDTSKLDYEAFLSPLVLTRYAQYMHKNRVQSDGNIRDGDNWQKGIPLEVYMKSAFRHFMELWTLHRGHASPAQIEEAICALLFNLQGYLFEILRRKNENRPVPQTLGGRVTD
jgi:hypothetical protein